MKTRRKGTLPREVKDTLTVFDIIGATFLGSAIWYHRRYLIYIIYDIIGASLWYHRRYLLGLSNFCNGPVEHPKVPTDVYIALRVLLLRVSKFDNGYPKDAGVNIIFYTGKPWEFPLPQHPSASTPCRGAWRHGALALLRGCSVAMRLRESDYWPKILKYG